MCQKFDMDGYLTIFPTLPTLSRCPVDTKLLWILSALLTRVKKLWMLTDQCKMQQSRWHGWILAYLGKICSKHILCRTEKKNPFKYTRSTGNVVKILYKHNGVDRTHEDIEEIF